MYSKNLDKKKDESLKLFLKLRTTIIFSVLIKAFEFTANNLKDDL